VKPGPVGERALVRPVEREEKTASSNALLETVGEKPPTVRVMAVGDVAGSRGTHRHRQVLWGRGRADGKK